MPPADNDQENYSTHSRRFPANGFLFVGEYLGPHTSRHIMWVLDVLAIVNSQSLEALEEVRDLLVTMASHQVPAKMQRSLFSFFVKCD